MSLSFLIKIRPHAVESEAQLAIFQSAQSQPNRIGKPVTLMRNTWGDNSHKGDIVIPRQVAKFTAHDEKKSA